MLCQIIPRFCLSHQRLCLLCYIILKELRFHVGKSCKEMLYVYQTSVVLCYCQKKQPPEEFCKKGVLRNFAKFTGKHLHQSLFFLLTLLKKRLRHRCFPVSFAKFLRTPFLQSTSGRMVKIGLHQLLLLLLVHFLVLLQRFFT